MDGQILPSPEFHPEGPPAGGPAPAPAEVEEPEAPWPDLWYEDPEAWWQWYLDNDPCRAHSVEILAGIADGTRPVRPWHDHEDDLVLAVREFPAVAARLGVDPATLAGWPVAPEAVAEFREAADRRKRGERDEWQGYLVVEAPERDELMARYRIPFRVRAVRRSMVPSYNRELGIKDRWELLIERAPLSVVMVVRLPPGNAQRDQQLEWLRDHAPMEQPLCLFHEELTEGRKLLRLERCEWPTPDERWEHLPASVRKRLLKEG